MASISGSIKTAIKKVTGVKEVHLETPEREEHGDYATNVALKVKGQKSKVKGSHQVAEEIVKELKKDKQLTKFVDRVEVAGPGFINFYLARTVLVRMLGEVLKKGDKFGESTLNKGKRVMFEYGQPNTHKLPHVGHLFSYIYGESMVRIMEATGWTVHRANYQGDVGPHVAKALWALRLRSGQALQKIEKLSLSEKVEFLQKMYQQGSEAYEDDEKAKAEIDEINIKIYQEDESIVPIWKKTRQWSLDYYKDFEKRLGIRFDRYYFESEVSEKGKEKVKKFLGEVFKQSQGAIIFEGSKYGLHDRVFVTKKDTPTYEAKDFYLQELKMKDWPADLLVISTASEQNEYFKVVFKALDLAHRQLKEKLKHIGFGMVNLKTGKLSSRKGEILGAVELVDTVVRRARQLSNNDKIAEIVGLGAVKYSFLKNNPLQDISFDIEESIKEEGNSGPYLQYTVARTQSVLRKAQSEKRKAKSIMPSALNLKLNAEELSLLRQFVHFPEVIEEAAENYSPNLLANYLYDLAGKFNGFYNKHGILEQRTKNKEQSEFRLALTSATAQILANGLRLLGIETPEKM